MRHIASLVIVCVLSLGTSFAQEKWRTFTSVGGSLFRNFSGEPVVTRIVWETEYGAMLPGRVYTVKDGPSTYSVTAVDYNPLKEIQTAKAGNCPPGLEGCGGSTAARRPDSSGPGYWKTDIRGVFVYAAFKYLQRDVKVSYYMWNFLGAGPEAHELQLINNADQSRTFVSIYNASQLALHTGWNSTKEHAAACVVSAVGGPVRGGRKTGQSRRVYFNGPEVDPNETFPNFGGEQPRRD